MDNVFQTLLFLIHEGRFDFFFLFICIYILNTVPENAFLRNNPASTIYRNTSLCAIRYGTDLSIRVLEERF